MLFQVFFAGFFTIDASLVILSEAKNLWAGGALGRQIDKIAEGGKIVRTSCAPYFGFEMFSREGVSNFAPLC